MRMLHNADIVDCLIFLETEGIEDAEIIEKMGINRSTLTRWWKENKSTPRLLQKMRKWCDSFLPITETYRGRRPPKYLFIEALEEANKSGEKKYSICTHRMRFKGFYEQGIPPTTSRAVAMKNPWRGYEYIHPPKTEFVIETIALFHPDSKIREAFSILSNENRQDSEVV